MPDPPPDRLARVPILTYHSLDESGSVISVAPSAFRRHMELLHEMGYRGVALGELLSAWRGETTLEGRPVALTFDDGLRNMAEVAAPVLVALCFRATVFVVAGRCGQTNDWPGQERGIPQLPLLSLDELKGLARDGFEVGAHGLTHAPLDALPPADAEHEVKESRRILEDALSREVPVFAYPYGRADGHVRACVGLHYRGACGVELGFARPDQDRHFLPRIDVYYLRRPALFALLGTALGRAYLGLRALGRRLPQRPRANASPPSRWRET
jgi:peptidoglycan/xylan/chitin deacetylase (PgdA/CDA1 family)